MAKLQRLPPRVQPLDAPKGGWADPRRGSSHSRGYGWQWQQAVKRVRARDCDLCQPCLRRGVIGTYSAVDHIVNKARGGGEHDENLQVICATCHDAKTSAEARGQDWPG